MTVAGTMTVHTMRVELRDEPSAFARVATALGRMGVNILDIDVHELDGTQVVDELVLSLPPGLAPGIVRAALLHAGADAAVTVPASPRAMDAVVRCLDAVVLAVAGESPLPAVVRKVVAVDGADVVPVGGVVPDADDRSRLARGIPIALRTGEGRTSRWTLVLGEEGALPAGHVLVVSRANVRFSATDVGRLRALLRVVAAVGARVPRAP